MEAGDRPRRDTGIIDDWDDNDSPCPLALREGAKFGDDQPLDLVFGLWDFFHNTDYDRLSLRWSVLCLYRRLHPGRLHRYYGGDRRTDIGVASIIP